MSALDVMNALACRRSGLAYQMNVQDDLCDLQDVMNALAYRKNEQAYQMYALAYRKNALQGALCAQWCDVLGARCDLEQTLLREILAYRPY
jgi:dTDP-4-dehydrorhamnose reductase